MLKVFHIASLCIFLGNILVSAFWRIFADRTKSVAVVQFATRMMVVTDIAFTMPGAVGIMVTGHLMAGNYGGVMANPYIFQTYLLFIGSGVIWALILVPVQFIQLKIVRAAGSYEAIPEKYFQLNKLYVPAGIVASLLPFPAIYLMTSLVHGVG